MEKINAPLPKGEIFSIHNKRFVVFCDSSGPSCPGNWSTKTLKIHEEHDVMEV